MSSTYNYALDLPTRIMNGSKSFTDHIYYMFTTAMQGIKAYTNRVGISDMSDHYLLHYFGTKNLH